MSSCATPSRCARARVSARIASISRVGALGRVVKQRQARAPASRHTSTASAGTRMAVVRDALVVLGREHRVVDDQVRALAQPYHALAHRARASACPSRAARRPATAARAMNSSSNRMSENGAVSDTYTTDAPSAVSRYAVATYGWLSRAHATFTSSIANFAESVSSLELDRGVRLGERNREVRIVRLRGEHRLQVQVVALARVHGHLVAALVERREVRQPLDVVPVRVADRAGGRARGRPHPRRPAPCRACGSRSRRRRPHASPPPSGPRRTMCCRHSARSWPRAREATRERPRSGPS